MEAREPEEQSDLRSLSDAELVALARRQAARNAVVVQESRRTLARIVPRLRRQGVLR